MTLQGLPHSDISGLSTACVYPELFAACHVLLRLSVPRHPSYALYNFTYVILVCLIFIRAFAIKDTTL